MNQRPRKNWAQIVEKFNAVLNEISGQLIVTARTPYYQNDIRGGLTVASKELEIPEWTDHECDGILAECGIVAANLQPRVVASLRNPRLLGIALELLEGAAITCLEELNDSRLLFEHIRMSEQDAPSLQPVYKFVQRLQKHAKKIISRIQAGQEDDLVVFEHDHDTLNAVADGRFFHSLEGDPTRYKLEENGLTLALGLAVIERLQFALRNNHDLNDELEKVIDPIAALDMTASVIFAALTVTCIDNKYPDDFATALIQMFANLQNPDEDEFDSFAHLARTRPAPFLEAVRDLCLSGGYQINFDWIQDALIKARADDNAWNKIFKDIKTWLSYYTPPEEIDLAQGPPEILKNKKTKKETEEEQNLAQAIREHIQTETETWMEKEKKEKEQRFRKNIEALSETEKNLFAKLTEMSGDLSTLSRFAFILLAGKPIKPAAQSLVQWSFANALNPDYMTPYQQFRHVILFNRIEWYNARNALLKEVDVLQQNEISDTGKRTFINILRATGSAQDAKRARKLDELTGNRTHTYSWRRVEGYCATDPCDPRSKKPDNVRQTAQDYRDIDVSQLWVGMEENQTDHFLTEAQTGMVRFEPQVAIAKHREFAQDVMHRRRLLLRQGLLGLREHNALLSREQGLAFANLQKSEDTDERDLFGEDRWDISQYCLLLAFPLLSGREQIDALLSTSGEDGILSVVMSVAKPIEETIFDDLLESACQKEDEYAQFVLMAFARETSISISAKSCKHVARLLKSQSERVRVQALGIIAQLQDVGLLAEVAHSGWQAPESNQTHESEYGSAVLTQAAACGIIDHNSALNRMSLSYYSRAAQVWSSIEAWDAVREVALRVDAAICCVANIDVDLNTSDIEMPVGLEDSPDESVEDQPKHSQNAYLTFRNALTIQKCDISLVTFIFTSFA